MNTLSWEKQKKLLKKYHYPTRKHDNKEDIPITGRSMTLYKKHLFPDIKNNLNLFKLLKKNTYLDIGSGINHLLPNSLLYKLCKKNRNAYGIDIAKLEESKCYKKRSIFNTKIKNNKINVITCHNLLYFWIDNPKTLLKIYKELNRILSERGELRIFPVFFGNYHCNDRELHKYLNNKFAIRVITPKYHKESPFYYHENKIHKESISSANEEIRINKKLQAQTLILYKIN